MKCYTSPPSDYGSKDNEWRNFQLSFMKVPICDHREGRVGDDVTLYYPGFQRFIDNCHNIELSKGDLDFAQTVCAEMSQYFKIEKDRENAFADAIKEYFKLGNDDVAQSKQGPISVPDIAIGPNSCVIIEVKNESGLGGESNSHSQAIAYYVQLLEERNPGKCPAPAYLIELVGPQLIISGAVYGRYVFVDRLVDPVWLVPQREEAMIRIARIFKALKEAIGEIKFYHALKIYESQKSFPIFQLFYKGNIQYEKAIKCHTFKGTLTYNNGTSEPVFVTFVKRYSLKTHELMAFHGDAPKLIHYEERVEGTQYTVIVMEYIPDAMPLDEFLKYAAANYPRYINNIKKGAQECCTKALKVMHESKDKYCHGKISSKSIIGKIQDNNVHIFIVNFKWAGRQGEATYPLSADIPEGVQPGDLITREQDEEQLKKLFQELNIN